MSDISRMTNDEIVEAIKARTQGPLTVPDLADELLLRLRLTSRPSVHLPLNEIVTQDLFQELQRRGYRRSAFSNQPTVPGPSDHIYRVVGEKILNGQWWSGYVFPLDEGRTLPAHIARMSLGAAKRELARCEERVDYRNCRIERRGLMAWEEVRPGDLA